jgi:hypothetical protein
VLAEADELVREGVLVPLDEMTWCAHEPEQLELETGAQLLVGVR